MNQFIKTFLACLLAFVVANILIGVFFVMVLAGIGSLFSEKAVSVEPGSVLRIDLSERIVDSPSSNPFSALGMEELLSMEVSRSLALIDVLGAIERAETDDRIEGIYLNVAPTMSLGMASLEEIRDAVLRFRQSGKWVIGYSDYYTQASYYMSTAAEKVYLNPEGGVEWVGLASGVLFYKGLLDKMDLQPEVIRHGEFKAAVEPFITDRMSPANRLQMERLLGSIWGHVVQNVASARGIDSTDLQRYASELTLADGESAVRTKMVDSLAYAADMERMLCERTGADDEPRYVSLAEYVDQPKEPIKKLSKNHIAVVYAEGQIVDGKSREGLVGGNSLAARLADVRRDDRVKAVGVRPLSSAERQFMQNGVERVYETFVGHVAEGRNMSVAAVDSIGGGRVWSGIDAVRIGLVDGFGGLREAIALAADRAGVAGDFRIVTPADELDPLSQVLRMMSAESRAELFKGEFGEIYSQYEMLQNILGTGGVQAIMPYDVRMR